MPQIGFDLEVGIEGKRRIVAILKAASEFAMQRRIGQIRDMRAHARHREPAPRTGVVGIIAPAAPFRIGHHGLAPDFMKGDVLRRVACGRRDRHRRENALRVARCPLQHLHAAHRAAHNSEQRVDAEMIEQHGLRPDHVAHRDDRKIQSPRHAGRRIGRRRARRAHAAADHVRADDKEAVRVDRPAGPDHGLPPAGLAGDRMPIDDVLIAGERMAGQHRVAALSVERAVGLIGDLPGSEIEAGVEPQRPVRRKTHHWRMRRIRLSRAVGMIEHGGGVGHYMSLSFTLPSLPTLARNGGGALPAPSSIMAHRRSKRGK